MDLIYIGATILCLGGAREMGMLKYWNTWSEIT
jgi:hypothetical protein